MENIFRLNSVPEYDQYGAGKSCFNGPKAIGCFSTRYVNDEETYFPDKSSLRYLDEPTPPISTTSGYDPDKVYAYKPSGKLYLLSWVAKNQSIVQEASTLKDSGDCSPVDFIASDGALKDFMTSPFLSADYKIIAIKIRGTIILLQKETTARRSRVSYQDNFVNKSTYSCLNIELVFSRNYEGRHSSSVNQRDGFFGVHLSTIGQHRILHSSRLDCTIDREETSKPIEEIKFTTIKALNAKYGSTPTEKSCLLWWSLGVLAGIKQFVVGQHRNDLVVQSIKRLDIEALEGRTSKKNKCFIALEKILDFVKSKVREDEKVYSFTFDGSTIIGRLLDEPIESYIPREYLNIDHQSN